MKTFRPKKQYFSLTISQHKYERKLNFNISERGSVLDTDALKDTEGFV
jgi:hypothetical protein